MKLLKLNLIFLVTLATSVTAGAAEPAGYYSQCEGKSGAQLLSALCSTIGSHTTVSYDGLWDVYNTSDIDSNGLIWDMYSTKRWNPGRNQCGSYKNVGDCYNREHSLPKSWFNEASPMKSDAFHVYPTDGKVNGQRSNFPYGECENGTRVASHNGIDALGKLGACTYPGYSGTVFEPDDEYKGDFARTYFYMAACYNGRIASWNSDMLAGNAYPAFKTWAVNLLLKWHRQDPVSQKELDRNEAVYKYQHNRNPFIDHPELAEHVWGNKATQGWDSQAGLEPELNTPANGSAINMGIAATGIAKKTSVSVKGVNITKAVSVTISGAGFSVSPSSLSATDVTGGTSVVVTYKGTSAGVADGILTLTNSEGINTRVTVTISCIDGLPVEAATNITTEGFTARWIYIGDADDDDAYTIDVQHSGRSLAGYPRRVYAEAEQFNVTGLEPETPYTYTVASVHHTSTPVAVTTASLLPDIQFLYDGTLALVAAPGEPSEPVEILVDAENISGNITVSATAPFQLSSDKTEWGQSIVLLPDEDRFYLRIFGDEPGTYSSSLIATATGFFDDSTVIDGTITTAPSDWLETFETEPTGSYTDHTYEGTACMWTLNDAGTFSGEGARVYEGQYALRLGKSSSSSIAMSQDKPDGVGTITFYSREWTAAEGPATIEAEYSLDHGATWISAGTATIESEDYLPFTFSVKQGGNVRIRLCQLSGARAMVDNIALTRYSDSGIEGVESDYRAWDAYCLAGELVIETARQATVNVYGLDGITYYNAALTAGSNTHVSLPHGLYIVVIDDFSRRVMVK